MVGWLFGSFVVLLLIGTPIAASLGLAAVITIVMSGMRVNMVVVGQTMFAGMTSYQLMAIPLFILCGNLMCDGGLSKKLVDFINLFCRKSKGALAYVTILASAFFAAISGSSPATTAAIGGIMAPEMQKNGYDEDFSLATAAAARLLRAAGERGRAVCWDAANIPSARIAARLGFAPTAQYTAWALTWPCKKEQKEK